MKNVREDIYTTVIGHKKGLIYPYPYLWDLHILIHRIMATQGRIITTRIPMVYEY